MCRSVAEGGQRCGAHARARLDRAALTIQGLYESVRDPETGAFAAPDPEALAAAREAWESAAVEFASTPTGDRELSQSRESAVVTRDVDAEAVLTNVLNRGRALRAANERAALACEAAARDSVGNGRGGLGGRTLTATPETPSAGADTATASPTAA